MHEFKASGADWNLFKEKIAGWQERYMESLLQGYAHLIAEDKSAADRFWELEQRIKEDKRNKGVQIEMNKSNLVYDLVALINEGAIGMDDLDGFSDELKDKVRFVMDMHERD